MLTLTRPNATPTTALPIVAPAQPHTLLALAKAFDVDADALRDPPKVQPKTAKAAKPAPTPSEAAHAEDKGATAAPAESTKKPVAKKSKAKADPAPAMPANEAATPPKTGAMPVWPFPTGARP